VLGVPTVLAADPGSNKTEEEKTPLGGSCPPPAPSIRPAGWLHPRKAFQQKSTFLTKKAQQNPPWGLCSTWFTAEPSQVLVGIVKKKAKNQCNERTCQGQPRLARTKCWAKDSLASQHAQATTAVTLTRTLKIDGCLFVSSVLKSWGSGWGPRECEQPEIGF
jgi:hypothetical protein